MSGVTILCPNARRCFVKVTPGTLLKQVLEEACLKEGFDVAAFRLVNQKRSVDLALPFRLSGLPNNATLEMVPASDAGSKSVATIALQVPQGDRLERQFPVSESLLSVLQSFSPLFGEDLTASRDDLVPCCSYMNRQYIGQEELLRITLSSIGITSGRCLIRYQRLPLTEEQKSDIANRLAKEEAKKEALLSSFAQKKAENEDRAQLEAARLARFEESIKREREKKEAEHQQAPTYLSFSPFTRDVLGNPPQNQSGWSFDAPVFAAPSDTTSAERIASLNRLLQQVQLLSAKMLCLQGWCVNSMNITILLFFTAFFLTSGKRRWKKDRRWCT
ncbi:hypothetical protein OESDEN_20099 [Oesophagostomum dentatum]|uniref:TUG ubiquitin-like domain-containing protein n=1 Tax=Oesophagostomum dentatum TaxID=61180 RepID=A0A0B1SAJ9_OESDE|nr:hypothetical protein OESDEN_20099 [Oesophagostomum dentatum]